MRKLVLVILCAAGACSSGPRLPRTARGEPVLEVRGALEHGPHALGSADLDQLPRRTVKGTDPVSGKTALWEGASVAALVSERVEVKKGADIAIVRTADRSAIPVPLTLIRQLKPVLADKADGARLATKVLAWPTDDQQGLATDPRAASWWARDVVAFEIVEWQQTFGPALASPVGATDEARRGASRFADSCISCHRLRGVGGEKGPDLTAAAARLKPEPFAAMLGDHPGWTERREERAGFEAAAEIWAFLRAVAASPSAAPAGEPAPNGSPARDDPASERAKAVIRTP
jgi:hypothetical protein